MSARVKELRSEREVRGGVARKRWKRFKVSYYHVMKNSSKTTCVRCSFCLTAHLETLNGVGESYTVTPISDHVPHHQCAWLLTEQIKNLRF